MGDPGTVVQQQGYRIIPVNPGKDELLGQWAPDGLRAIDGHVDVVDVFRPPEEAPDIARAE